MTAPPVLVAVMGVSGCGKSTVARALADALDMVMVEADDYHGEDNIAQMARGEPLTDAQRGPWMDSLCAALKSKLDAGQDCALAFSGLRRIHRDRVRALGYPVLYLHLEGEPAVIAARMASRTGHFMPPGMLASQCRDLEPTDGEADVQHIRVDTTVEQVTDEALQAAKQFLRANDRRREQ